MPSAPVGTYGLAAQIGPPERMVNVHAHAELELNLLISGRFRYFIGGQFLEMVPGRLTVFWAAMPHRPVEATGTFAWLTVPLPQVLRMSIPPPTLAQLLAGEVLVADRADGLDEPLMQVWYRDLAQPDSDRHRSCLLEVEARLLRLLPTAQAPHRDAGGSTGQLAAWMAARYQQPITPSRAARAVGLNPTYAMGLFRRHTGMTMGDYLLRLRLAHAQRLLLTEPKRDILDIAFDSGFGSSARFYAAFTKATGQAPGAFRRLR